MSIAAKQAKKNQRDTDQSALFSREEALFAASRISDSPPLKQKRDDSTTSPDHTTATLTDQVHARTRFTASISKLLMFGASAAADWSKLCQSQLIQSQAHWNTDTK